MSDPRICLALTVNRDVDAFVTLQWFDLLRGEVPFPGPVVNGRAMYVVQARNECMTQAFDRLNEWDALLFWDIDQLPFLRVPGPNPFVGWEGGSFTEYLTFAAKDKAKKVRAGLYYLRKDEWVFEDGYRTTSREDAAAHGGALKEGPHEPLAYVRTAEGTYRFLSAPELVPMLQERKCYRIGAAGTGSMLIQKDLLLRMAELKGTERIFDAPMMEGGGQWTEDLWFCEEVTQKLGEWIWLDTNMESAHRQDVWIHTPHYFEARGFPTRNSQPSEPRSRIILGR